MRKVIIFIAVALFFLAGLAVLMYPAVADYFNSRNQSRAVEGYYSEVADITPEDLTPILEAANAYNAELLTRTDRFMPEVIKNELERYNGLLTYKGSQIMGVVEIPTIGVNLPIYHGTSEGVLQVGTGHMEGTSLPVGGPSTHSVVTGHRGLPSATLFTHLDKLIVGDTFSLHILKEVLTYKVDQIIVTEPDEMDALAIEEGKDLCTLVTCTPYGINSHRMQVRGHRVENAAVEEPGEPVRIRRQLQPDAQQYDTLIIVAAVTGAGLLLSAIIGTVSFVIFIKTGTKSGNYKKGGKNQR